MIGVVTGVQGMRWYEVTVTGQEAMPARRRCTAPGRAGRWRRGSSRRSTRSALDHPPHGGRHRRADARSGRISRNIMPGEVFFTIDLRHPEDEVVARHGGGGQGGHASGSPASLSLELEVEQIWYSPPVKFDPACVDGRAARRPSENWATATGEIVSRRRPRCRLYGAGGADGDGLRPLREAASATTRSRSAESTHLAAGANVLLRAVLEYATRDTRPDRAA